MIDAIIVGMFDPLQATGNILFLMKGGILISALTCAAGLLVQGRAGAALAALLMAFFIFYVMDSNQYVRLGQEIAGFLTLNAGEIDTFDKNGAVNYLFSGGNV